MTKRKNILTKIIGFIALGVVALTAYLLLHEFGHCIAVWLSGGKVTGFHILSLSPQMTFDGVADNPLINISGTLLPLIVALIILSFLNRAKEASVLFFGGLIYCASTFFSLFSWAFIPVLYMQGFADMSDDVVKFIFKTGAEPPSVALLSAAVAAILITLLIHIAVSVIVPNGAKVTKKIILFSLPVFIVLILLSVYQLIPSLSVSRESFNFIAKDGGDSILKENFEIEIKEDGEYEVHTRWTVDRDNVIVAIVLSDETKTYFNCSGAVCVDAYSEDIALERGKYTMSVYAITDEAEWNEYLETAKTEVPDFQFDFGEGEFKVDGNYSLKKK